MSEPIQNRGQLHEGEKRLGELLVAGADAAVFLDATEEVFDPMAAAIVSAMKAGGVTAAASWWDAAGGLLPPQTIPEAIGVEALVGHTAVPAQGGQQRAHRMQVMPGAGCQAHAHRPAVLIDDRRQLGVQPALGPADGLRCLPASRIGSVLVQLDVRAVHMAQGALGTLGQAFEQSAPQAARTPASPAGVNRTPRAIAAGCVTPRAARAQHIPDRRYDNAVVLGRSPAPQPPPARFGPRTVNFFSRLHSDSARVYRSSSRMTAPATQLAIYSSTRFENTP